MQVQGERRQASQLLSLASRCYAPAAEISPDPRAEKHAGVLLTRCSRTVYHLCRDKTTFHTFMEMKLSFSRTAFSLRSEGSPLRTTNTTNSWQPELSYTLRPHSRQIYSLSLGIYASEAGGSRIMHRHRLKLWARGVVPHATWDTNKTTFLTCCARRILNVQRLSEAAWDGKDDAVITLIHRHLISHREE